jgi:hypothetical protein
MKVLLLHPEDRFPLRHPSTRWDLIVDLGRAPSGTYERWRTQAGCEVFSLYRYAVEIDDVGHMRDLLRIGNGFMVDGAGIDWWDLLCLFIAGNLQQLTLVHRLASELSPGCDLYASRPHLLSTALRTLLGARLTILETRTQSIIHSACHYRNLFSHSDAAQLAQVLEDKFDGEHSIRRRFSRRDEPSGRPVILLPSAYSNVSRTGLSYAGLLPDQEFLLVHTRSNARPASLPANVRSTSLTPYFVPSDKCETAALLDLWTGLKKRLVRDAVEFSSADGVGILEQIPKLLPWAIALRNAWSQLFEFENVTACLSADDSNPPSSIPLLIAKKNGLPALACHHGALDYMMAMKVNHADAYLAKSEMEEDYLKRVCRLAPEQIVVAAPALSKPRLNRRDARWMVFFSEPYASTNWRVDEVYRDLLPRLHALAQTCGLRLVLKLHPFESVKGHRKMLRRIFPGRENQIDVLGGTPSQQLWNNTKFALTVQSSTALECAALEIPVFLCAWLRDPYVGYVQQYSRFGVGHVLESSDEIAGIPALLGKQGEKLAQHPPVRPAEGFDALANLFSRTRPLPIGIADHAESLAAQ